MPSVLLLSDFTSGYSRLLLKGVLKYAMEAGNWRFYRIPLTSIHFCEEKIIEIAQRWKADAIIGQFSDIKIESLRTLGIPILLQNYTDRARGISNITGDYYGTGEMAANYFLKKGYTRFAFYGTDITVWSREREDGFRSRLAEVGIDVACYNENRNIRYHSTSDLQPLQEWLAGLPKPAALFACDDAFALRIAEVCGMCNIRIPSDLAVLGVDNDEILCNMSDPPLSSIVLDVENGGYQAAAGLHRLVENKETRQFNVVINPVRIERKKSTEGYSVSDPLVAEALRLIEGKNNRQITIREIVDRVCVSRRVLEKHFRKEVGMPVYQYMQDYRASCFAEMLLASDLSVMDIAAGMGYDDYVTLSKSFKRIYCMTPTQYRNRYKYGKILPEIHC